MEVPEVGTRTDLSFEQLKSEYRNLTQTINSHPGSGWASWLVSKMESRLNQLRKMIADYVTFGDKKNGR